MFSLNKSRSLGSAVSQIDLVGINDGIIQLKNRRYRSILQTTSINFELKSEEERDAIIDIYEGFLNAINFPLQFLIRTREIDIDDYLDIIDRKLKNETHPIYKQQLKNSRSFIKSLILDNKILSRQFYVVVGFDLGRKDKHMIFDEQLDIRTDIVTKSLNRLGISCRRLKSLEVIDLFYNFYNPEQAKSQPLNNALVRTLSEDSVVTFGDTND